jgi:hypothetical protein
MIVQNTTMNIEGTILEGENPLPVFRNRNHHSQVLENGSLTEEQKAYLGYETGERFLPYRIQDRYARNRKNIVLKTITLENDILKAVFLPDYGGRLYSLVEKRTQKDTLYKNPVFQPANLAILNAWFSGGIEWNIGQLGHAFTTCSPLFAVKLKDDEGYEFLRMYEYERCKNLFWHIDFHLPKGSDKLLVYVRIVNDNENSVPMYWWTNIAVRETKKARVFSTADKVIHLYRESEQKIEGFGFHEMPYLPSNPGYDASYPMQIPFSNEYFFQTTENCKSPWEAVAYEDGTLFYERSTSLLRYRKMFCWGNHRGGRQWCDFLSKPGEGNYIEVQGGFAPTQLHGIDIPANTTWDFTQVIGMSQVDTDISHQDDWKLARDYIGDCVCNNINENELYGIHQKLKNFANKNPVETLNIGSGWGALERMRREKLESRKIPEGFHFDDMSLGKPQHQWVVLLQEGHCPDADVNDIPESWMVQDEWMKILEDSLKQKDNQTWNALMHYGVMLYEKGLEDRAFEVWKDSLKIKPSPWVYRNLAVAKKHMGDWHAAIAYLEEAYNISNRFPDRAFAEEYLDLLINNGRFQKAWEVYLQLPLSISQGDRILIIVGRAALELEKYDFLDNLFNLEFAVLREGEMLIVELWYLYRAKMLAKERKVEFTEELVKEVMGKFSPPDNIDFRLNV